MKQLNRINKFPEREETNEDRVPEAAQLPQWKCYCCGDTGFVQPSLVTLVIPNYNSRLDPIPVCQRCDEGDKKLYSKEGNNTFLYDNGDLDDRFTANVCEDLDSLNRQYWAQWQKDRFALIEKTKGLVNDFVNSYGQ